MKKLGVALLVIIVGGVALFGSVAVGNKVRIKNPWGFVNQQYTI